MDRLSVSDISLPGFEALASRRRSVRGFRPDALSPDLVSSLFEAARASPSNCNVQPWHVHVVSGAKIAELRDALVTAASSGVPPTADIPLTSTYAGFYRERQVASAKALFEATGVARDDPAARIASAMRNFTFFDAPHVAFVFMPDWAGPREAADCGMYAQTLVLAMTAAGVSSCAQAALGHHAGVIKRALQVDPAMQLLFGISFGLEDESHPANATRTVRAALDEIVTFHG